MFLVQLAHDVAAHVVKSAKGQITFVRHDCNKRMWAGPAHGPLFLVQIVADRRKTVADRQQETLMKELEDVRFGVTRY